MLQVDKNRQKMRTIGLYRLVLVNKTVVAGDVGFWAEMNEIINIVCS